MKKFPSKNCQKFAGAAQLLGIGLVFLSMATPDALAQGRAATVFVETVERSEIRDTQDVIGRLVATKRSDIATRIAGVVKSVEFKIGDQVASGRTLIKLDAARFEIEKRANEAAIVAAKAGLSVAQAKLKLAQQTFKRQADLKNSTAFSRSRFDDLKQAIEQSRSEVSLADAQMQMAKVGLDRANYQLTHTVIVAPFDGIAIARQAQPGEYLQAGGLVATLLDITDLEIAADVPGAIAEGLFPGTPVTASFESGLVRQLSVRTAIPVQNSSTRTRLVRFTVDLTGLQPSQIAVGGTITLKVPVSAARSVTTVPKDALLRGSDGWMVYAVEKNKALPRPVVLGQTVGNRMEVISGVKPGAVVVVRGNERLRPGQSVRAKPVAPPRPKQG
jgi:RND family efflux transporter MFP subunit